MNRSLKKIIYGVVYAILAILIFAKIFNVSFEKQASCFDNKQNQNETGIDCGGVCGSCALKNLESLRVSPPAFLSLKSGQTVLLADITNPNPDFGVSRLPYTIRIFDKNDFLVKTIRGIESIYGSEKRYIFAAETEIAVEKIGKTDIVLSDPEWRPMSELFRPAVILHGKLTTEVSSTTIRLRGVVSNQSSLEAREVGIIGVLFDKFGQKLFASKTLLDYIPGFEEKSFNIAFPYDTSFAENIDNSRTQVFISAK